MCCLEKPCLEAGISTLVLQFYRGYRKCIDSRKHLSRVTIILSAVLFYLKCGAILRISLLLWSVLPSFHLITLKAYLYREGKRRNQYQKRTFRLIFRLFFDFSSMLQVSSFSFWKPSSSSHWHKFKIFRWEKERMPRTCAVPGTKSSRERETSLENTKVLRIKRDRKEVIHHGDSRI